MSVFEWDEANVKHIGEHDVSPEEAEEALLLAPLELDSYVVDGELRFEDVGQTEAGRILKVVSTLRDERVRVVTAFDASAHSSRLYLQARMLEE